MWGYERRVSDETYQHSYAAPQKVQDSEDFGIETQGDTESVGQPTVYRIPSELSICSGVELILLQGGKVES
jgi:hypothetical protein